MSLYEYTIIVEKACGELNLEACKIVAKKALKKRLVMIEIRRIARKYNLKINTLKMIYYGNSKV